MQIGRKPAVIITRRLVAEVQEYRKSHTQIGTARYFNIAEGTVNKIVRGQAVPVEDVLPEKQVYAKSEVECSFGSNDGSVTVRSLDVKTLEDALRVGNVDMIVWEVDRYVVNSWEVTVKDATKEAHTCTNWQVKVWLKRKGPLVRSLDLLLEDIKKHGPYIPKVAKKKQAQLHERELEISLFDPHLGLHCFTPGADHPWDIELCTAMCMEMLLDLLQASAMYGPFKRIVLPIGNDLFHADGVFHTTTQGTLQPEMDSWQHVYMSAEKLAINEIGLCLKYAPVKVISIMGNHDRQSTFTLGRLLAAYYHNAKDVEVDASSSPYKFHHFGVNLIGFEHGHSIHQTVRLAALMANECRNIWSETSYREWHLGDQHRKGSSKPCMFEEQGVSVEFLPGITPPNEWHRLRAYNWQKRAGMAFVWDKEAGPIARLQVNVNSYTGKIMKSDCGMM